MTKQDYLSEKKVEYDGIIFTPKELEVLSSDSSQRYKKLINKNRDFTKEELTFEEIKQLIKDITELGKAIDDKDKYIDFLIEKIKKISNNSISTEIARNIAEELMPTLGSEKSIINLWYEKKIANFCVSVLNNIIIKRNRIVYQDLGFPHYLSDFKDIDELIAKLNSLKRCLNLIINNEEEFNISLDDMHISLKISDSIKRIAESIKEQIEIDIITLPEYTQKAKEEFKNRAQLLTEYLEKKAQYESKSKIGRFIDFLNGKNEKDLIPPEKLQIPSYYYGPKLGGTPFREIASKYGRTLFSDEEILALDAFEKQKNSHDEKKETPEYKIYSFSNPTYYYDVYEEIKKGKGSR